MAIVELLEVPEAHSAFQQLADSKVEPLETL